MSTNNYTWPQEQLDRALELRASGLSFQAVATALGLTKNAVMGKFDRLGLLAVKEKSGRIEFPPHNGCQFPFGNPSDDDFRFCGELVDLSIQAPYCPNHRKICYSKLYVLATSEVK